MDITSALQIGPPMLAANRTLAIPLIAAFEFRPPGVYIKEVPTGARPIEGVGTSTAGFVGSTEKRPRWSSRRAHALQFSR